MNQKSKEQKKILKIIKENKYNGVVIAPTGTGKGKVMIDVIKALKPKSVLYCCDNRDLRDKAFKEEVVKWGAEEYLDVIDMQCYQTTYKYKNKHYDLLLADEGDFMVTPNYIKTLTNNKFNHKLVFTGTFSDAKLKIIKKHLPVIYKMDIQDAENDKLVNKAQVYYVNYQLTPEENKKYLNYSTRFRYILSGNKPKTQKQVKQLEAIGRQRKIFLSNLTSSYKACRKLMKYLYNKDKTNRVLIFCASTTQADRVCKVSYHGKNEEQEGLEKFNSGKANMCAVVDKVDRGLNINNVNNIIYETCDKSNTKVNQRTGRGRRLKIGEVLNIYFLVPYHITRKGNYEPTVVYKNIQEAARDLNLEQAKTLNI